MTPARWRGGVLLALVAVALCTALAPQPATGAADPLRAVNELLAARAAALRAGDRAGWLEAVDPRAPASFRAAQARSFDGWRALPLASYELEARTADSGDLDPAPDRFLPETRQRYRFAGFDDRDAVDTMWWTYVERGGRWYVGADDALADLGLESMRNLWDLGPVRVRATEHFLVVSRPAQAARADALAVTGEEAMRELAARWPLPWRGRIPMILPASVGELETILQSTFDLDNFVAFVVYGSVRDGGYETTAPRIYIQDRNLSRYAHRFQLRTLVHELVHAATVPISGPYVPAWVHEGVADWVAAGEPSAEAPPKGSDGRLPRDDEFSTGGGGAIVRAYDESRSAIAALAGAAGAGAPAALFRTLGERRVEPGSVRHLTDAALRQVAGFGLAELERRWAGGAPEGSG